MMKPIRAKSMTIPAPLGTVAGAGTFGSDESERDADLGEADRHADHGADKLNLAEIRKALDDIEKTLLNQPSDQNR